MTNNLAKILKEKGISPYKMSADLGIHNQSFYDYLYKPIYPRVNRALRFADYLGVEAKDIWEMEKLKVKK